MMSLFPSCDSPLTIRPRVKRNGREEWHVVNPATGKILRACETETDAREFAESWASGLDAIEDGVAGRAVAGVFVPGDE
jgi:hypothetical protein